MLETIWGAVSTLAISWEETKRFFEHSIAFSRDALHVIAGVVFLLVAAALVRKPVSNIWPWLIVLALAIVNEFLDLWIQRWPNPGIQYGESAKDLILTMALPTLLMLSARLAPGLYRSRGS